MLFLLDRWEEKKKFVQMLTSYNQLKGGIDESVNNFSFRGIAKLHFAEAFDDKFSLFLRERRSPTLA